MVRFTFTSYTLSVASGSTVAVSSSTFTALSALSMVALKVTSAGLNFSVSVVISMPVSFRESSVPTARLASA